jgi:hypothetical protein
MLQLAWARVEKYLRKGNKSDWFGNSNCDLFFKFPDFEDSYEEYKQKNGKLIDFTFPKLSDD